MPQPEGGGGGAGGKPRLGRLPDPLLEGVWGGGGAAAHSGVWGGAPAGVWGRSLQQLESYCNTVRYC